MSDLLERDVSDLRADVRKLTDEVKSFGEDFLAKHRAGETISAELKERTDKALADLATLGERLREVEQAGARAASLLGEQNPQSLGQLLAASADFKSFAAQRGRLGKFSFDAPAGASINSLTSAAGGALRQVDYVGPGIVPLPQRRLRIRDLLMPGSTDMGIIEYHRETGFTNNAAVVSETVQKPESVLTFEAITSNSKTIAHYITASKQILADVAQLRSHVDGRLTYGLKLKEETQFLTGSGAGGQVEGLVTAATSYSAPITLTGDTFIDTIRLMLLQAVVAEYDPDGIVLNPKDWARVEVQKDSQGRYIVGDPQGALQPRLWGLPVVQTNSMTEDKCLVGSFGMAAQIFDREGVSVQISDEDGDNFKKNMVTILVEERTDLAIYRPESFIYGDLGNVA